MNDNKEYQTRLLLEYKDLIQRRNKIESVINSEHTQNIESKQMELLRKQYECMLGYEECLFVRILDLMK